MTTTAHGDRADHDQDAPPSGTRPPITATSAATNNPTHAARLPGADQRNRAGDSGDAAADPPSDAIPTRRQPRRRRAESAGTAPAPKYAADPNGPPSRDVTALVSTGSPNHHSTIAYPPHHNVATTDHRMHRRAPPSRSSIDPIAKQAPNSTHASTPRWRSGVPVQAYSGSRPNAAASAQPNEQRSAQRPTPSAATAAATGTRARTSQRRR